MDERTAQLHELAQQVRQKLRTLEERLRDRQCEIFEAHARREDARARAKAERRASPASDTY